MDSDSELSINDQISIIKMLDSHDLETTRLALSIVDKYPRPMIMVNYSTEMKGISTIQGKHPILFCLSFQQFVREAASFELSLPPDNWNKENREMLERLQKY